MTGLKSRAHEGAMAVAFSVRYHKHNLKAMAWCGGVAPRVSQSIGEGRVWANRYSKVLCWESGRREQWGGIVN